MKFIEIASEQEFACEYYGYEKYWILKEVPREVMLIEYDKYRYSDMQLHDYLVSVGVKRPQKRKFFGKKKNKSK
jgi:hypothetical protein